MEQLFTHIITKIHLNGFAGFLITFFLNIVDRNSESESITNEDSSDTNMGGVITNNEEPNIKSAGKQSTNSLSTNGTQNGTDRNSPLPDLATAKQKNIGTTNPKKNNKKARHR